MLNYALPKGFSERGFVPFRVRAPVETFELGRSTARRLDVVFYRHGRIVVCFIRIAFCPGRSCIAGVTNGP